jgi:hypothetical protein
VIITPEVETQACDQVHVSGDEVEQAVRFSAFRDARWHDHPEFGRRLLVRGLTDERVPIVAILKPINEQEGIWECKTARRDL